MVIVRPAAVGFLLFHAAVALSAAPEEAPSVGLDLSVEGSRIEIDGVSPSGQIILLGIAHEPLLGAFQLSTWVEGIVDEDGDALSVFDLERPVPPSSVWAALDLASGATGHVAPDGFPIRIRQLGQEALEVDPESGRTFLRLEGSKLRVLVIRRNAGAWSRVAYDGGVNDLAPEPDGWLRIDPTSLLPALANQNPLDDLREGDLVAMIDLGSLEVLALRVPEGGGAH